MENEVNAHKMLHDPQVIGNMDSKQIEELAKSAGYGEESCRKAANAWALERMRRELPP